jgi:hypothetical protein
MFRISELVWTENELQSSGKHGITPDEIEEALGVDGGGARYMVRKHGHYYAFLGETGNGELVSLIGEKLPGNKVRIFHADYMNDREKAKFRKGK